MDPEQRVEVKAPGPVTQIWGTQHPRCPKQAWGWLQGQEEAAQCWDLPSFGPSQIPPGADAGDFIPISRL